MTAWVEGEIACSSRCNSTARSWSSPAPAPASAARPPRRWPSSAPPSCWSARTQSKIDEVKAAIETKRRQGRGVRGRRLEGGRRRPAARLRAGQMGTRQGGGQQRRQQFHLADHRACDREMARADRGRSRQRLFHVPRLHSAAAQVGEARRSSTSPRRSPISAIRTCRSTAPPRAAWCRSPASSRSTTVRRACG